MPTHRMFKAVLLAVSAAGILSAARITSLAAPPPASPRVFPPQSLPYGHTYGEWGAAWWQWAVSFPLDQNPIFDPSGEFNEQNQSGPVWYLAGTSGGAITRDVTIPRGKAIFFPIINVLADYPCPPEFGFEPAPGQPLDEFLTEVAVDIINHVTELEASVDGVALQNLFDYRGTSSLFIFTGDPSLAAGFDPCITGSPQEGVSDGYWVMLAPLGVGQHTIHFRGKAVFPDFEFEVEVTYNVTIAP